MPSMTLELVSDLGNTFDLKLSGFRTEIALIKIPWKLRRFVNKVNKAIKTTGETIVKKKMTFHGKWNMMALKVITEALDSQDIEWWFDP